MPIYDTKIGAYPGNSPKRVAGDSREILFLNETQMFTWLLVAAYQKAGP